MADGSRLANWQEWHALCALGLCSQDATQDLRGFAHARFLHFARAHGLRGFLPVDGAHVDARDAWHLFETHLGLHRRADGRPYKQWLFARVESSGDAPLDVIQGGASLVMRDVVREWLRRENHSLRYESLQAPVGGTAGGASLTLEDLLPDAADPYDELAHREFAALADAFARSALAGATPRERLVLRAKAAGAPLATLDGDGAAGARKTTLHQAYRSLVVRIAERVQTECRGEDAGAMRLLTVMILERLKELVSERENAERAGAALFYGKEDA